MKTVLVFLAVLAVLGAGFFLLNDYIYTEKQGNEEAPADVEDRTGSDGGVMLTLEQYFYDRMVTLGIEDIGHPIEGFDANLLTLAFPGLRAEDFSGVETFEGHYEIINGEAVFVRDGVMPVSSAESTVSESGYASLLENVARRLGIALESREDVDRLIASINTGERIETKLDQGGSALGVKVTPHEVLEDSRCPIDVTCIQAGTVRLRATLESGLGTAEQEFELNVPITTEAETVTLIQVDPVPESTRTIDESEYAFIFEIKKRE